MNGLYSLDNIVHPLERLYMKYSVLIDWWITWHTQHKQMLFSLKHSSYLLQCAYYQTHTHAHKHTCTHACTHTHVHIHICCSYWSIRVICWSVHINEYTIHNTHTEVDTTNCYNTHKSLSFNNHNSQGYYVFNKSLLLTSRESSSIKELFIMWFPFDYKKTTVGYLFICTPRLLLSSNHHSLVLQYSNWEHCNPALVNKWGWLNGHHRGNKVFGVMTTPTDLYEAINGTTDKDKPTLQQDDIIIYDVMPPGNVLLTVPMKPRNPDLT